MKNRKEELLNQVKAQEKDPAITEKALERLRKGHISQVTKLNAGFIIAFISLCSFFLYFLQLLCQKLDGEETPSIFLVLLPFWIIILPVVIFVVIKGLATSNNRATLCEKIIVSAMVPLGSLLTFLLLLAKADDLIEAPVYLLSIPHIFSLICFYLYVRCLVKHVKIHAQVRDISKK